MKTVNTTNEELKAEPWNGLSYIYVTERKPT